MNLSQICVAFQDDGECARQDVVAERTRHMISSKHVNRIFLLSPADCGGKRAQMVLRPEAQFALALRLKEGGGVPIGELFSFLSGLYFRGKLAYSKAFSSPPEDIPGILVITPNMGLVAADYTIDHTTLRQFSASKIKFGDESYREPLNRDAVRIAKQMGNRSDVILLGSLATDKYLRILGPIFRDRLQFPSEFVGLGDMSRGALLLRCVKEARELEYVTIKQNGALAGPSPDSMAFTFSR